MADITPIDQIRAEKTSFKDSILSIDHVMPLVIKEVSMKPPGLAQQGGILAVYNMLLWKHTLVQLRASYAYTDEVEEEGYQKLSMNDFQDSRLFHTYKRLMEWNALMIRQYPKMGITEPLDYVDWWGTFDQTLDSIWFLLGNIPLDKMENVKRMVDKAIKEKHCYEDAIPEELDDDGVGEAIQEKNEKILERQPKRKVVIDGYELP